jgi:hypothetical protein
MRFHFSPMVVDAGSIRRAVQEIENAFAGMTPPGDDELLHPLCMDDGDVVDFCGGPDRSRLSDDMIIRNYAASSFFSARAFQYYMPAFMIWTLKHYDTIEYVAEATVRAFDPGTGNQRLRSFQVSKFALFSEQQRQAVIQFLRTISSDAQLGSIAEAALENYWRR